MSLCIVPPAFALIALCNIFGAPDMHTYGVFFVAAFVWIGMVHPSGTSVAMAPLAAAAYVVPLFFLPGSLPAGLVSAAISIPICVAVGEGISWGVEKLDQTELAWQRERDRADRLLALFEITDEGGGIPAGDEQIIFEPFITGSSSTGGTGMGLAIVRGIARAHGGETGVNNRPGRGATFWIRIPR